MLISQPFTRSNGSVITANPSFEAIVPLTDIIFETPTLRRKVRISTQQIPVSYQDVQAIVPTLHKGFDLIIHAGLGQSGFITLEKRADSGGYYAADIHGRHGPLPSRGVYVTPWDIRKLLNDMLKEGYNVFSINF